MRAPHFVPTVRLYVKDEFNDVTIYDLLNASDFGLDIKKQFHYFGTEPWGSLVVFDFEKFTFSC